MYSLVRMLGAPVLYVVRHGWTGDDNSYNSPVNPVLDHKGLEDAKAAADFLATKVAGSIYTSGFRRAFETASIIGDRLDKTPQVNDGLDSWDIGDISKATSSEEADRAIDKHVSDPERVPPGGESLSAMRKRIEPVLRDGVAMGVRNGKPPIFVAHHSVQHEVGRVFNNDDESALTHTGGVVAVILTPQGLKAVPVFRSEKE
jgi:glucosyl-3-phosphoglycerate phosphatase